MGSESSEDAMFEAAIKASLEDGQKQSNGISQASPQASFQAQAPQSNSSNDRVVDLTNDSDGDSDVQVVFPKSTSVVGSDTDADASEDDAELKHAIALSLGNISPENKPNKSPNNSSQQQNAETQEPPSDRSTSQGILGLDRKQMEQERLMRLNKRKASITAVPERLTKAARASPSPGFEVIGSTQSSTTASSHTVSFPESNHGTRYSSPGYEVVDVRYFSPTPEIQPAPSSNTQCNIGHSEVKAQPVAQSRGGIQWPSGTVKKTRLANSPRKPDDVSIEEVLQRNDLELAALSSFLRDFQWVLGKLDTQRTRILFVVHAENEERPGLEAEAAGISNLRFCFPSLDGQINIMHSKLMLLFHPDYLRIVVPTANLIPVDWGEHNLMENTVFMIDLPLKGKTTGTERTLGGSDDDTYTQFYNDLVIFLKASSYPKGIIEKVAKFDFSKTARYAFVHSIGGSHVDETWRWTGYTGLGRAVSNLGLKAQSPVNVDFITSSLGALNEDLIRAMYLACKGDDGLTDYRFRNTKPSAKASSPLQGICEEWRNRFRVYFPSFQTVDAVARAAGNRPENIGGTVCFSSKYWNSPKLPKHVLKDCPSQRDVLMHNKIVFVRPSGPARLSDGTECQGWAYVGSANFSESAWGRLVKDRATGEPKLNIRNWECGVLVPVTAASSNSEPDSGHLAVNIFNDTIPVPMKVPSESLGPARKPWFVNG